MIAEFFSVDSSDKMAYLNLNTFKPSDCFIDDLILEVYEEDVGDSSSEYDEDEDQVDDQLEDQDSRHADPLYLKPIFL